MSSFLSGVNGHKLRSLRQQLGLVETLETSRMDDLLDRIQHKQRELGCSGFLDRTEASTKDSYLSVNVSQRNKLKDIEVRLTKMLEGTESRLQSHLASSSQVPPQNELAKVFASYRNHLLK